MKKLELISNISTGLAIVGFVGTALAVENSFAVAILFLVLFIGGALTTKACNYLIDMKWEP